MTDNITNDQISELSPSVNTGRPRFEFIRQYFKYSTELKVSQCKIGSCSAHIQRDHVGNMERHLNAFHKREAALVRQERGKMETAKLRRSNALSVTITVEEIKAACVELVTTNGRPFALMDDSGFKKILNPLIAATQGNNWTISSASVRQLVISKAAEVRASIRADVMGRLICLKVDAATRHDRGFLGINVQFIENGVINVRTLGIIELTDRHSAENLKKIIEAVLNVYGMRVSNIYSFTSDNGTNMVKLGKLLSDTQCLLGFHEDEARADDLPEDNPAEETTEIVNVGVLDMPEEWMPTENTPLINTIRCSAHTLQLGVEDALKTVTGIKETMAKARKVAKTLRTPTIRKLLKASVPHARKPQLDVVTRWHSTADMLQSLMEVKAFCIEWAESHKTLALTEKEWQDIEAYLKSLLPAKIAALRLQNEQLTLGGFYAIWIECKVETGDVDTDLAREVVKAMEKREAQLMENDALLASVFLDPRYHPLLPKKYHEAAITKLEQLWEKLQEMDADAASPQSTPSESQGTCDTARGRRPDHISSGYNSDKFQELLNNAIADRLNKTAEKSSLRGLLNKFIDSVILDSKENILSFWKSKKHSMPELEKLATVVHAAPATQVTVERLFSGMRFIFGTLRANLQGDILDDIMVIRCNDQNTKRALGVSMESNTRHRRRLVMEQSSPEPSTILSPIPIEHAPVESMGEEIYNFLQAGDSPELENTLEFSVYQRIGMIKSFPFY